MAVWREAWRNCGSVLENAKRLRVEKSLEKFGRKMKLTSGKAARVGGGLRVKAAHKGMVMSGLKRGRAAALFDP